LVFLYTSLYGVIEGQKVTSIGNNAFANCYRLTSVTIPEGVTNIGRDAFKNTQIPEQDIPAKFEDLEALGIEEDYDLSL